MPDIIEQIKQKFYTAQEAQKALGMNRDAFNNLVRRGTIKKHFPLGKSGTYKHGMYDRKEIDAFKARIESALLATMTPRLEFRNATVDDMDQENKLAYIHFGKGALSPERKAARRRYIEVNPLSTFHLYNDGILVASINIVPLKHEAILEFREGKRGWKFPDEMIEQFEPGHRLETIIIDMMVGTTATTDREKYASELLLDFAKLLRTWGEKGIDIKSIDACGGSPSGKRILKSAEFEYLGEKDEGRDIYHLDIDRSDLVMLQPYKQALADWKERNQIS